MKAPIARLREVVAALGGLPILEWRDGYGNSGSFHLGRRVPDASRKSQESRGSWILNVWGASVSYMLDGAADDGRRHPPAELRDLGLGGLAGRLVEQAVLAEDGTLSLYFASQVRVDISPDVAALENDEQWALESESHGSFVVRTGPIIIQEASDAPPGGANTA